MGRKKKRPSKPEKPYCWYCDRDFQDEKILAQHQKAKHFKCHVCHKKLLSASGMIVHVFQVHKETISKIPNAKPGRDSVRNDIIGMEGIPGEEDDGEPSAKRLKLEDLPPLTLPPSFGAPAGQTPNPPSGQPPAPYPASAAPPFNLPPLHPGAPWFGGPPGMGPPPPMGSHLGPPMSMGPRHPPHGFPPGVPGSTFPGAPPGMNLPFSQGPGIRGGPPPPFTVNQFPPGGHSVPQHQLSHAPSLPGAATGTNTGQSVQQPFPVQKAEAPTEIVSNIKEAPSSPTSSSQGKLKVVLVYEDPDVSMEEKRAKLDRYVHSKDKIQKQVSQLDQNIESRMHSLGLPKLG